ncbi:nucleoside triphosphate pyrophosphohydrolase [Hasllibacter halocynthiae]|nr:nucleoside triphosphate pyrophosphohydrolase [Hasllibacter halocynthiae]
MRRLRDPGTGCPWDVQQDFDSIAPYTIEEAHEVADAIRRRAWDDLRGELGDLLLQVIYHSQMAEEAGHFTLGDVVSGISAKMIARHPHVFGDASRDKSPDQQSADWEAAKAAERAERGEGGTLDGVALGLPALMRAQKLSRRLARVGFDWDDADGAVDKIAEEAAELAEACAARDGDATEAEMGDLLFTAANLARLLGVDPEAALRRTNAKVVERFAAVEDALARDGLRPAPEHRARMERAWQEAKG